MPEIPDHIAEVGALSCLFGEAKHCHFLPHFSTLWPTTLDPTFPASVVSYVLSCDRFLTHLLVNFPDGDKLIRGKPGRDNFSNLEILPTSPTMELDVSEMPPPGAPSEFGCKASVKILSPVESCILCSCWGHELQQVTHSLEKTHAIKTRGGVSKAHFYESWDHRFLIKTMPVSEFENSADFAHKYYQHAFNNPESWITHVLFICRVDSPYFSGGVIIMEKIDGCGDIFDLKGTERRREADGETKKDTQFQELSIEKKVVIPVDEKQKILEEIKKDTEFLAREKKMDYSLFAIVNWNTKRVIAGMIDIFAAYTMEKAVESWVKKTAIYEEHTVAPTVISPEEYRNRFISALDKYFFVSPQQQNLY